MPDVVDLFETMEYGPAPESDERARAWLEERGSRFGHYIGGAWREPAEGGTFETPNPATGKRLATVAQGSEADVDAAGEAGGHAPALADQAEGIARQRGWIAHSVAGALFTAVRLRRTP
jgi:aldehyde dehydrogenase (NAD+)